EPAGVAVVEDAVPLVPTALGPLHLQPADHGEVRGAPHALRAELQRRRILDECAHDADLLHVEVTPQDGRAAVATDGEQRLRGHERDGRSARGTGKAFQAWGAPHSGQNLLGLSRRAWQRGHVAACAAPQDGQNRDSAGTGLEQAVHALAAAPAVAPADGAGPPGPTRVAGAAGGSPPPRFAWLTAWVIACPIATPAPRPAPAPAMPPSLAAATGIDCAVWYCV